MSEQENQAARLAREIAANTEKVFKATQLLANTRDEEVKVGTTPKHLVMRRDKVELFRYEPLAQQTVSTPVLVAYGLVGRYTMADLQPDRSLVRSLLNKGLDLWLIDWGQPGRNERWLTIDDYVDDYIDAAVDRIRKETGHDRVTLLGICEGGVFTVCYAALHPEKVKNLVITITPIDFHADINDKAAHHGFINLWTRSLDPADIDKLVETYGVLPGEFMSSVFSMMTPMRSLTKYNFDLIDVVDDEDKFMNFLRMEKWLADRPHHIRGSDHRIEIRPALRLDLVHHVLAAHEIRPGFGRLALFIAAGDHQHLLRFAEPVGHDHGAAHHLVGVLGVDAQPHVDLDRLVELGELDFLDQRNGLFELILAGLHLF